MSGGNRDGIWPGTCRHDDFENRVRRGWSIQRMTRLDKQTIQRREVRTLDKSHVLRRDAWDTVRGTERLDEMTIVPEDRNRMRKQPGQRTRDVQLAGTLEVRVRWQEVVHGQAPTIDDVVRPIIALDTDVDVIQLAGRELRQDERSDDRARATSINTLNASRASSPVPHRLPSSRTRPCRKPVNRAKGSASLVCLDEREQ